MFSPTKQGHNQVLPLNNGRMLKKLTIIVSFTQQLEEAEEVTCKFIVRHHFLIWAAGKRIHN